jgi:hypothetical protein
MALLPPFFLDCVVALGVPSPNGSTRWAGTGFIYFHVAKQLEGEEVYGYTYVVTNKHVIAGWAEARMRCNPSGDAPAREYRLELVNSKLEPVWFGHPNPDVDIAVIEIDFAKLRQDGMQLATFISNRDGTTAWMHEEQLTEGDDVYVLGFPMGMVGGDRNAVIVRSGTIARVRDVLSAGAIAFLIDASVYPGNSGGPVVLKPEALAIEGTKSHNEARLLGIVRSYVPYSDVAISSQTNRPRVIFEENTGLAEVHPVDLIAETVMLHRAAQPPDPTLAAGEALTTPESLLEPPQPVEGDPAARSALRRDA